MRSPCPSELFWLWLTFACRYINVAYQLRDVNCDGRRDGGFVSTQHPAHFPAVDSLFPDTDLVASGGAELHSWQPQGIQAPAGQAVSRHLGGDQPS